MNAQSLAVNSEVGKLGRFYAACMNDTQIADIGTQPLRELFSEIQKIDGPNTLARALAVLHQHKVWAFFELSALQDFKDATRLIGVLDQAGLGLPDRKYYFADEGRKRRKIREAYFYHLRKMLRILGMPSSETEAAAKEILKIETSLARVSKTWRQRRIPVEMYNKVDIAGVRIKAPRFPWNVYFERLGYPELVDINVTAPLFLAGFNTIVAQASPRALQNYLRWHILNTYAHALPRPLREEQLKFKRILYQKQMRIPRWMQCIDDTNKAFGELLAQVFVEKFFDVQSKTEVLKYIEAIRDEFAKNLQALTWMDRATKERALEKLQKLSYHIGYPDTWGFFDIDSNGSYLKTLLKATTAQTAYEWSRIGQPVDRNKWEILANHVNAYYHPLKNQLVFPAGILQPPFYSKESTIPVNFGAMGAVFAHELSHGFDAQGAQFDGYGNLNTWWTLVSKNAYHKKAECLVEQYSQYQPIEQLFLDGEQILSESIADLGGIKIAYAAFQRIRGGAVDVHIADGYTEEQQFFISNAQVWCAKATTEDLRQRIASDPHADARSRVNGTLSNMSSFSEAFQCEAKAPMVKNQNCSIW